MTSVPDTIGVVGAGTMGAGIAQLAAQAGARTLIYDAVPGAAEKGRDRIGAALERLAEKGRLSDLRAVRERLETVVSLADLAGCGLIIEAAPERLELKRELFGELERHVAGDAVLASNTSSIPITAIAAGLEHPERVVGMHFFNPAPVMKLLEVVAGDASSEDALALARATGEAMRRHVIDAADGPGFLVNRCNRPFGLEALRLVQEGIASPEQIDRIVRMSGGFRMGPFELQDLVGIDVGLEVSRSFYELSFGEPRWRPSTLSAKMVAAGRHGRKTGRGWYEYGDDGKPIRDPDPLPPDQGVPASGFVVIAGDSALADELRSAAADEGWDVAFPEEAEGELPELIVDCGGAGEDGPPLQGAPQVVLCDSAPLAAMHPAGVGFFALPPLGPLVELTRTPSTPDAVAETAERFFASIGRVVEWVGDAPGLVLGRIVAQVVNESCFAVGEGVGSPQDVDAGMVLGMNHPRGPLEWADMIGPEYVLAIILGLHEEYREERYRPAPWLIKAVREERGLRG